MGPWPLIESSINPDVSVKPSTLNRRSIKFSVVCVVCGVSELRVEGLFGSFTLGGWFKPFRLMGLVGLDGFEGSFRRLRKG